MSFAALMIITSSSIQIFPVLGAHTNKDVSENNGTYISVCFQNELTASAAYSQHRNTTHNTSLPHRRHLPTCNQHTFWPPGEAAGLHTQFKAMTFSRTLLLNPASLSALAILFILSTCDVVISAACAHFLSRARASTRTCTRTRTHIDARTHNRFECTFHSVSCLFSASVTFVSKRLCINATPRLLGQHFSLHHCVETQCLKLSI